MRLTRILGLVGLFAFLHLSSVGCGCGCGCFGPSETEKTVETITGSDSKESGVDPQVLQGDRGRGELRKGDR